MQIRNEAAGVKIEMEALANDFERVKADLTGFLISDTRARTCQVEQEADALAKTFDSIEADLAVRIAQSAALAETLTPDPAFATADAEISSQREAIERNKAALAGAMDLASLLRSSIADRDAFKLRADKAWFRTLRSSEAITPWFNRQKEMGGETEAAATRHMDDLNADLSEARRLYGGIEFGFTAAKTGNLYNCSNWAVSVVRIERLADTIEAKVSELAKLWKPAP